MIALVFLEQPFSNDMIATKNLSYTYDGQQMLHFPDLRCAQREQLLLLGKSGVGKTTLLHLLGGLMKAKEGSIIIGDTDMSTLNAQDLDNFRGNHIGIVFQSPHFIKSISVLENLLLAQSLSGNKADPPFCRQMLDKLDIAYKADDVPANLSQGEKQRLSIARALVNKPLLVLADEPTSALDDQNCTTVINLLEEIVKEVGAALIIVTHDTRLKDRIDNQVILQN